MIPCPLCTLQRLSFALLGFFFLIGIMVHRKRWAQISINLLATFASAMGIFFAGRQVWVQHFPTEGSNECGVSLQYMMEALPWKEAANKIFSGSAECTQRGFEFLSMNMPEWALICFLGFAALSLYLLFKKT